MRDVLEKLITLLELIGAWILFGAPLFQSVTELYEELEKREKLVTVINQNHTDQAIKKVSFWWWLFPPIKIALEKKKLRQIKKMTNHQLSEETKEALHRLSLKANGWAGVSLGGWIVAVSTTWEFVQSDHDALRKWFFLVFLGSYISIFLIFKTFRHKK